MTETEQEGVETKPAKAKHESITFDQALPHHVVVILGKVKDGGGRLGFLARLPDQVIGDDTYSRYTYNNNIRKALIFPGMPTDELKERIRETCEQFTIPVRIHYVTLGELAARKTPKPKFKR